MIIQTDKPLQKRRAYDFYPTPLPFCEAALNILPADIAPETILDTGAGTGVWGIAARRKWRDAHIEGVEIRDVPKPGAYDQWHIEDYRLWDTWHTFDLIIGNPPFMHAESFVRDSLKRLRPHGYLLFLLRLGFLEGKARAKGLYTKCPPKFVYIAGRISFTGDGKTDATPNAVIVWQKGYQGETKLSWELMR